MTFDVLGLPDSIVHTQLRIHSLSALPPGETREGVIDISYLSLIEVNVPVQFGLLERVTTTPIDGLYFEWLDLRAEETPLPRLGQVRLIWVRMRNESNDNLTFNAVVTLAGQMVPPLAQALDTTEPALPNWTSETLQAQSMGGVTLRQAWRRIIPASGTPSVGAVSLISLRRGWFLGSNFRYISVTRNEQGVLQSAQIEWPDETLGVYSVLSRDEQGRVSSYSATCVDGDTTTTFTQPTIPSDAFGITGQPPLIIS
jgi:hypothetical protein